MTKLYLDRCTMTKVYLELSKIQFLFGPLHHDKSFIFTVLPRPNFTAVYIFKERCPKLMDCVGEATAAKM